MVMELTQEQSIQQRLVLTQTMRQSLECLQLSAFELNELAQNAALSNPLLDVQAANYYETSLPTEPEPQEKFELREGDRWSYPAAPQDADSFGSHMTKAATFREYLEEQIGQMRYLDEETLCLCRYLIGCLDDRGYLDCPLEELAEEIGCPLFSLEQALFAVQMLDPPGVGARSLSECLILQLAQGSSFDRLTLAIARDGLALLGKRDHSGLAAMLGVSVKEAKQAAEKVRALNPIPARGFSGGEQVIYIAPDAVFSSEQGRLIVTLNQRILPRLSVNSEYSALLTGSCGSEVQHYVQEKIAEANSLIRSVQARCDTLLRLLTLIAEVQHDYFSGGDLLPMTMQQAAEALNLSTSTVSRAVQNKYIEFNGSVVPLRSFFTTSVRATSDADVSAQAIKQRIRRIVCAEDTGSPLSDEEIRSALESGGIAISRRTVAKYRTAMGIPSSERRREISLHSQ